MNERSGTALRPMSRGFTVVELAAIVAVTAVIGALAVSAFRTYTVRAQIVDGVSRAEAAQEHVAQAFHFTGIPPTSRHDAGLSPLSSGEAGGYLDSIEIHNGRVDIRFNEHADAAIAHRTLSLTPFETADRQVVWICGNKIAGVGLQPLGFAGAAHQAVQILTSIQPRYLPSTCR